MLTVHFKSGYWSDSLLKYSVQIMGDYVDREGTVASKITKISELEL
jgi:hypothetical protein